jgi:hypothetical protein
MSRRRTGTPVYLRTQSSVFLPPPEEMEFGLEEELDILVMQ